MSESTFSRVFWSMTNTIFEQTGQSNRTKRNKIKICLTILKIQTRYKIDIKARPETIIKNYSMNRPLSVFSILCYDTDIS